MSAAAWTRMARRALLIALSVACAGAAGCVPVVDAQAPASDPVIITVSAATSLKRAFETIGPQFEAENPGVNVRFNHAASGVLAKQIEQGAPVDVFVSASPREVDGLAAAGLVAAGTTATVCGNDLVLIVPAGTNLVSDVADLAKAERIALVNPETAPVGAAGKGWLENLGSWDEVAPKAVYGQNVAQTLDYVARGEVDAGLVFASEALGEDRVRVVATAPAAELAAPISYVTAPVGASSEPEAARAFVEFLGSPRGQELLKEAGLVPLDAMVQR